MRMTIVFNSDNSQIVDEKGLSEIGFPFPHETKGTHHYKVVEGGDTKYNFLISKKIAIPISSVKFFILG